MSSRKKEEKLCPEQMTEQAEAVGRQIQQDRQEAGFSREEIEHLTKISPFFLESLEAGRFLILPGEVFCKGFIRNIYRVLKKDPQAVVVEIEAIFSLIRQNHVPVERKRSLPPRGSFGPIRKSERSRLRTWSVAALILVVGSALIWRVRHSKPSVDPTELSTTPEPLAATTPATPAPTTATQPPAQSATAPTALQATAPQLPPVLLPPSPSSEAPMNAAPAQTTAETPAPVLPPAAQTAISESQLTMVVRAPVGVRQKIDGQDYLTKEYPQGEYQFAFQEKAEFVVQDAAEVSFTFDSKTIETLGKKKEMKKITFVHSKQDKTRVE
jgi:cytoskeleton protein RodZ